MVEWYIYPRDPGSPFQRMMNGCPITSEMQSIYVPLLFSEGEPGSIGLPRFYPPFGYQISAFPGPFLVGFLGLQIYTQTEDSGIPTFLPSRELRYPL